MSAKATFRDSCDAAMERLRSHRSLDLAAPRPPHVDNDVAWLSSEMFKTRLAIGHCLRHPVAGICLYANICEQCESLTPHPRSEITRSDQLADVIELRNNVQRCGWNSEVQRQ